MSDNGLEVTAKAQLGQTELDVSVRVEAGRCLALAGPSGAGKTSVLRAVAGLLRPHEGVVRCGDELWFDTATGVSRAPDRRRVGYLFQNYALFPHLRGWQNVAYPLRGQKRKERRAHAVELLERFGVGHLADVRPGTYSGGESQLSKAQRCQRSFLGRFQYNGAPRGERGTDFPYCSIERAIPWNDRPDYPDRLLQRVGKKFTGK